MSKDEDQFRNHLQNMKDSGIIKEFIIGNTLENGMIEVYITPISVSEFIESPTTNKDIIIDTVFPKTFSDNKLYPPRKTGDFIAEMFFCHDLEDGWYSIYLPLGHYTNPNSRIKVEVNTSGEAIKIFSKKGYTLVWGDGQSEWYKPDNIKTWADFAILGIPKIKTDLSWVEDQKSISKHIKTQYV